LTGGGGGRGIWQYPVTERGWLSGALVKTRGEGRRRAEGLGVRSGTGSRAERRAAEGRAGWQVAAEAEVRVAVAKPSLPHNSDIPMEVFYRHSVVVLTVTMTSNG
jgi:hypothetical protein